MSFWEGFEKRAKEHTALDDAIAMGGAITGTLMASHAMSKVKPGVSGAMRYPLAVLAGIGGGTVASGTARAARSLFGSKKKDPSYPTVRHEHEFLGRV